MAGDSVRSQEDKGLTLVKLENVAKTEVIMVNEQSWYRWWPGYYFGTEQVTDKEGEEH